MDNLFIWLFLGPFMYSIELGGPIIGLLVTGYLRAVYGFRGWLTFGAAFLGCFFVLHDCRAFRYDAGIAPDHQGSDGDSLCVAADFDHVAVRQAHEAIS